MGLSRWTCDGQTRNWTKAKDGLPDDTVLDLSAVPGDIGKRRLWIATNDGVALLEDDQVTQTIRPKDLPGPVDALVARPDGSALLAYNPIDPNLFLSRDPKVTHSRRTTQLRLVSKDGTIDPAVWQLDHEVRDLALAPDGETVWIGTDAGLYRMTNRQIQKVSAGGRLADQGIHRVSAAPDGTVWLGIDRQGEKLPAQILAYDPAREDLRFLTVDSGLPVADRIEMLDFLPDGRLATMAAGRLLRSDRPMAFPPPLPWWQWAAPVVLALLLGVGATLGLVRRRAHRDLAARYADSLGIAERLFKALGQPVRRLNERTLALPGLRLSGLVPATGAADAPGSSSPPVTLYAVLSTLADVGEVQSVADRLKPPAPLAGAPGPADRAYAYLLYPRDLDPAARFQLDTLRLRERKTIIPLSLPFARRALDRGSDGVRTALDALNRRYLAQQDLFDMRNALDEPRFFFGRRALIDELIEAIGRGEHSALIGQRKIGKTSLLNVLGQRLDRFPLAQADLQAHGRGDDWPSQLFAQLLASYDQWGRSRLGARWDPAAPGHATGSGSGRISGADFQAAIRARHALRTRLGVREPLVVMLDEVERIFPRPVAAGGTAEEVWRCIEAMGALRALGQQGGQRLLCLIVADRSRAFMRQNRFDLPGIEDTNPFYDLFVERYVPPLAADECAEMLRDIGHAMGIKVTDGFADLVFAESGGYPRLARLLASAACRLRGATDQLDPAAYAGGLAWLTDEDGSADNFIRENLWQHVFPAERVVLARCAGDLGNGGEAVDQGPWDQSAAGTPAPAPRVLAEVLREARQHLMATGLLERLDPDRVRVRGALVRRWLGANLRE